MRDGVDLTIKRHVAAVLRHEERLNHLRGQVPAGACCPTCFHGATYTVAVGRAERCSANLVRLLEKRGAPADVSLVAAIRMSAWP